MIVGESYVLGQEASAPPKGVAIYPDSPPELPGLPYRVSAYLMDDTGSKLPGLTVQLLDQTGKKALGSKTTDTQGKVYFDLGTDTGVVLRPIAPAGSAFNPTLTSVSPVGISMWHWNTWDWKGDSTTFVMSAAEAPTASRNVPTGDAWEDFKKSLTASNILIALGLMTGAYVLYRWISPEE